MSLSVKTLPIEFSEKVAQKKFPKNDPNILLQKNSIVRGIFSFWKALNYIKVCESFFYNFPF
jgi:hypothetical protein